MKTTKIIAVVGAVAVLALSAGTAVAAEASVSADLASAYVFRGATFNDGAVLQPGLEVSGLPVTIGVWGNLDIDDYNGALEDGQFSEIDLYASYDLPVEAVALSVGYTEYTYPSGGGDADREVSLSAGLDLPLSPSLSAYYGLEGGIKKTLYLEAGLSHAIEVSDDMSMELGAALGYVDPDEGASGFSHYSASLSASYKILSASVTYIGQIDDDVLPDVEDGGAYDVDVVGTVGIAYDF